MLTGLVGELLHDGNVHDFPSSGSSDAITFALDDHDGRRDGSSPVGQDGASLLEVNLGVGGCADAGKTELG